MRMITVSSGAITTHGPTSVSLLPANDSHGRPEILAAAAARRAPLSEKASPTVNPPPAARAATTNSLRLVAHFMAYPFPGFERHDELPGGCAHTYRSGKGL